MPLPSGRNVESVRIIRKGKIYVFNSTTDTYVDLGVVQNVRITAAPLQTDMDSAGRAHTYGFKHNVTFSMMQVSNTEIAAIPELSAENEAGTTFKIVDSPKKTAADIGIVIENVSPAHELVLDFNSGPDSRINVAIDFTGDNASVADYATAASAAVTTRGIVLGDFVVTAG